MSSRSLSLGKAAVISVLLLAALFWFADFDALDFGQINLHYMAGCILLYVLMLNLRALGFGLLASEQGKQVPFRNWAKLVARHQLVFLIAPSGSGDLAFPHLAHKVTGIDTATATGIILRSRLRDICTILGLGVLGLVSAGIVHPLFTIFTILAFAAMIWVEQASRFVANIIKLILPKRFSASGWADRFHATSIVGFKQRARISVLTLVIWLCASAAIWAGFLAAGYGLSYDGAWIMIAGLNIAGALAVSIAGFGIAEAGATGVLMLIGETAANAAAIAIIARLGLLFSLVIASGLLEALFHRWFRG